MELISFTLRTVSFLLRSPLDPLPDMNEASLTSGTLLRIAVNLMLDALYFLQFAFHSNLFPNLAKDARSCFRSEVFSQRVSRCEWLESHDLWPFSIARTSEKPTKRYVLKRLRGSFYDRPSSLSRFPWKVVRKSRAKVAAIKDKRENVLCSQEGGSMSAMNVLSI